MEGGSMKEGRFWIAVAVTGVAMNVVDTIFQGYLFAAPIYERYAGVFRQDASLMPFYIVGDFVAVLVVAWLYLKVRGSFDAGLRGGAIFGFYVGMVMSFPMYHFAQLMIEGFPYWVAWVFTFYGIFWGVATGTLLGKLLEPKAAPHA
jgi:hypothetical protein